MKRQLNFLLKTSVSIALIGYLIYSQDFKGVKDAISSFNPVFFFIALGLSILGIYVSSLRWQVILHTSGKHVSLKELAYLYTKGYFYNNFLPTQMGGDFYKAVSLGKKINNQPLALFSVFMDRFGGLIVLLIMALFGISTIYGTTGVLAALVILIIGLVFYYPVLNLSAKKVHFLRNFKEASDVFIKDKKRGLIVISLSFLIQIVSFLMVYILFLGLGINLSLESIFLNLPLASLSSLIPSFNGIGTQDTIYAFLFKNFGITAALSITVSLMIHAVRLLLSIVGGILILFGVEK